MSRYIPIENCVDRTIYLLNARNFSIGVFNAETNGFIGIREKFGSRYLFTEYHADYSESFGTAAAIEIIGRVEDDRIKLWERYPGSFCQFCGRSVDYDEKSRGEWDGDTKDYTSWPWQHIDPAIDCNGRVSPMTGWTYYPLYQVLKDIEEEREALDGKPQPIDEDW